MKHIKTLALAILSLLLTNCTFRTTDNSAVSSLSISTELDSSDMFNDKILYGNWFTPHEASIINITFHKNNTFKMNDYKKKGNSFVFLTREGTFCDNGKTVTLKCDNGEEKTLEYTEIEGRIYLSNNNIMMIKGLLN